MRESLAPALEKGNQTLERRFKLAYVAAAVSLLVVITVIPSFGFFKFAHDAATEMAAKHGQLRALEQVLNRRNRISDLYHKLKAPQALATKQIGEDLDRYDQVGLKFLSFANYRGKVDDTEDPENSALQKAFDDWLALLAPWFPSNELGSEMRTLKFDTPVHGKSASHIDWTEISENIFRLDWHGEGEDPPKVTVDSTFSEWAGVTPRGWMFLGLLCLLVGRWFFLLMKNIFLAIGHAPTPFKEVDWQSCEVITGNFLVLGDPRSGRSGRLSHLAGVNYFDLRIELDPHVLDGIARPFRRGSRPLRLQPGQQTR